MHSLTPVTVSLIFYLRCQYESDEEEEGRTVKTKRRSWGRKGKKKTSIYDVYEPSELERGHFTERDSEIRVTDMPERFQVRRLSPMCSSPHLFLFTLVPFISLILPLTRFDQSLCNVRRRMNWTMRQSGSTSKPSASLPSQSRYVCVSVTFRVLVCSMLMHVFVLPPSPSLPLPPHTHTSTPQTALLLH